MKRLLYNSLSTLFILAMFWLGAAPAHAQSDASAYMPLLRNGPLPLCRVGINGTPGSYPIKPLRLGWYLDYSAGGHSIANAGLEYYPMLRLEQTNSGYNFSFEHDHDPIATEAQLRASVAMRPGSYWFIGNEPDRKQYQDDIEPQVYAQAYHDLYHIIKSEDPTAKIVAGAIVQPTPVRLQYLDMVLAHYQSQYGTSMPVDVWAFHNFVLNEANCSHYEDQVNSPGELEAICWGADIPPGVDATDGLRIDVQDNDDFELFKQQVVRFREWMAANDYRNTPAFLSEFGVLMPPGRFKPDFDSARVNDFMNKTFDYLLNTTDPNIGYPADNNRLVQRFAWYSIEDKTDHNGFLFDYSKPPATSRTEMGDNFFRYTSAMGESNDFFPTDIALNGTTLQAVINNSGNLAAGTAATVRFFDGDPNSGGKQIGNAQTVNLQGCGDRAMASVQWNGAAGSHTVYVQVSASSDLNTSNNQTSATVNVSN